MTMLLLYICPLILTGTAVLNDDVSLPGLPLADVDAKSVFLFLFGQIDVGNTGQLTSVNLKAFLNKCDKNKDGIVVKAELLAGASLTESLVLGALYDLLNLDNIEGISDIEIDSVIHLLDTNYDGAVTLPDLL
ncbi:hypothetical protein BsWGS_07054 [Bradybaena similaris]